MAPLTRLTLGIIVIMLTIAGCRSVTHQLMPRSGAAPSSEPLFITDRLLSTFRTLGSRQCLQVDGFDTSAAKPSKQKCVVKLTDGSLAAQCDGASPPALALYYNCFASSLGHLGTNATSFDIAARKKFMLSFSDDEDWKNTATEMLTTCKRTSPAKLTPRQQAVYSYICVKWSMFSDCDRRQEERGTLDAAGALRRARFLSGDCPLSPSTLLDTFGMVTGRTWEECSQGNNTTLMYASEVSRIVCLLQDFSNDAGNVDFTRLIKAIDNGGADYASTSLLLKLIDDCGTSGELKQKGLRLTKYQEMTTEEFVKCWASKGVFNCAQQEANQVASSFPETCAIPADLN